MSSLLNPEMIFSEHFSELSYEEQVFYAGVIHSIVVENFKNINHDNLIDIDYIDDIIVGLDEIINTFIELELVDYLEDILAIKQYVKKIL
jgi:hypothetical protein